MDYEHVPHGNYTWPRIAAELNFTMNCQYGGAIRGVQRQLARRSCDDRGQWKPTNFTECATFSESHLANLSNVSGQLFLVSSRDKTTHNIVTSGKLFTPFTTRCKRNDSTICGFISHQPTIYSIS